jgi:hypothetical protein
MPDRGYPYLFLFTCTIGLYSLSCCSEYVTVTNEVGRLRFKCDDTRAETKFRLSAKRTSPFKSAGASVQSTTGSRGVRISGSNTGYTIFRVSVKSTGYPLHSPVSPSLLLPCVTVCHHWTLRYLTTAAVYFMCGLFKDAVSNPGNVVSSGMCNELRMLREEDVMTSFGVFPGNARHDWGKSRKVSRLLVYEQKFVSGIYRMRGGSVSTWASMSSVCVFYIQPYTLLCCVGDLLAVTPPVWIHMFHPRLYILRCDLITFICTRVRIIIHIFLIPCNVYICLLQLCSRDRAPIK